MSDEEFKLTDEEMEIFEVAYFLQMPVYKLVSEMPYEEFLGWLYYFRKRPVGWREDQRTSLLLSASGAKIEATEIFPSLMALKEGLSKPTLISNLRNSPIMQLMMNAKGGNKITTI
jgi:hypothetical protein